MKYSLIFTFWTAACTFLLAQRSSSLKGNVNWNQFDKKVPNTGVLSNNKLLHFEGAVWSFQYQAPLLIQALELGSATVSDINLIDLNTKIIGPSSILPTLKNDQFLIQVTNSKSGNEKNTLVEILPLRLRNGMIEGLLDYELSYNPSSIALPTTPPPPFTKNSVLENGLIYKIAIDKEGVYKLDKSFIQNNLTQDLSSINPKNIRIFTNGGGMLPESNSAPRVDDLAEIAILVTGEADGVFNDQDAIYFYGKGPHSFSYATNGDLNYSKNIYSDYAYFFVKFDQTPGLRINSLPSNSTAEKVFKQNFVTIHHQKDLVNLLEHDPGNHGSGQRWFGEELSGTRVQSFGNEFTFDEILSDENVFIQAVVAGRCAQLSTFEIKSGNQTIGRINTPQVYYGTNNIYANPGSLSTSFKSPNDNLTLSVNYLNTSVVSEGWLDYVQASAFTNLKYFNKPLLISHPDQVNFYSTGFNVLSSTVYQDLWNVTDPLNISGIKTDQIIPGGFNFQVLNNQARGRYVYFDRNDINLPNPKFIAKLENQNLHGLETADMLVVYHKNFKDEALRFAKHRSSFSGLNVVTVDVDQVANEFGGGVKDPSALRDMCRMLYSRAPSKFRYLLLFGDGSYDFRHVDTRTDDQNFVPTYETLESLSPIISYPSDDYFGLLDDSEGEGLRGGLEISIGRFVCRTNAEAQNIVDKVISYDTDPKCFEEWRLNMCFMADDEDGNIHLDQVEELSTLLQKSHPVYNQSKVYLDAYEQITTPGGERYPTVTKAISDDMFKGQLVYTYLGHGGPTSLTQERVLKSSDIIDWDNQYKLPLMITATCTFNGFDDPSITNAGEEAIHSRVKGAIALFSTVRAVYSDDNFLLTSSALKHLIEQQNGSYLTLGETLRKAKNENSSTGILENSRKFMMFGDPAQNLALPKHSLAVTSINDKSISAVPDTFSSLQTVKVSGYVAQHNGDKLGNFNGKLYINIFDKPSKLTTRGNDKGSYPRDYYVQKNTIFKGIAAIKNGDWEFSFIIPKDINYSLGQGKMSLYATDEKNTDAASYFEGFYIGGTSSDSLVDDKPPVVQLFMNDDKFVTGGITDENPKIYSKLSDDTGINISGSSIGHDILAVLDRDSRNPIILNSYFKSELNEFKKGEILYPLKDLSPGTHTLTLTAWDLSNNLGEATLEFQVKNSENPSIDHVYNFPNPFSTRTQFQFETNISGSELEVQIRIQSISGKVVRTIGQKIKPNGYRIDNINWDGKDDFGNPLANGVYLYRVHVSSSDPSGSVKKSSDYQKLLILR
ncbi:MAG: type IX secretion system sortase PorU [Saprospiraceae bacterium]|nr:type IX secretion system sortase PorU [Saprospiraceae bacterium]